VKVFSKWDPSYGMEPLPWIDPFSSLDPSMRGRVEPGPMVVGPEAIHWFGVVQERCQRNEGRDIVATMAKEIAAEEDVRIRQELFGV
jgi:hypothetical protein